LEVFDWMDWLHVLVPWIDLACSEFGCWNLGYMFSADGINNPLVQ